MDSKGAYILKPGGFTKKTISAEINGHAFHLVSYYHDDDVKKGVLVPISSTDLASEAFIYI